MNTEDLIKNADIQKIVAEGTKIYQGIKANYDPQHSGKFLAIDTESQDVYLGSTSAEAVDLAKQAHPKSVFFVVKIGFDTVETMAEALIEAWLKQA